MIFRMASNSSEVRDGSCAVAMSSFSCLRRLTPTMTEVAPSASTQPRARRVRPGVGGAALIIDCTTDNRVRTVADVRHALTKNGGNMGTEGSVSFMFKHVGEFLFAPGTSEDAVMEAALEAGADDVVTDPDDGSVEVTCDPSAFDAVTKAFEAAGLTPEMSEITYKALNETVLTGDDAAKMQKLIDALEDLDDVQQVYTSAVFDDEE